MHRARPSRSSAGLVIGTSAILASVVGLSAPASAAPRYSPDTTVVLSGTITSDEDVVSDTGIGTVVFEDLGALPPPVEVDAYHRFSNGQQQFSIDVTAALPGGLTVEPADVVRFDGSAYSLVFDASAEGLPEGANVDAITASSGLVLSFDTTLALAGGITAADEDLVRFTGAVFQVVFDGSAAGVPERLDVDGASIRPDGSIDLSFDASGQIAGIDFDDEDVLRYDPSGPSWSLLVDGEGLHTSLAAADVVALPEPGAVAMLAASLVLLALLARFRRRRPGAAAGAALALLLLARPGLAGDGASDISQAKVDAGGGFPFTIGQPGSYRLTSSLLVPSAATPAIEVTASGVTLDLNGFAIRGPVVCTGGQGGAVSCSGVNPAGIGVGGSASQVTVRNGIIHGLGGSGIALTGSGVRVDQVIALSNGFDGIAVGEGGVVTQCLSVRNGDDGFSLGNATTLTSSSATDNGDAGVVGGFGLTLTRNASRGNAGDGIAASRGSALADNAIYGNGGTGISCTAGCNVNGNAITSNGNIGLVLQGTSGYVNNVIHDHVVDPVSGGVNVFPNLCDGSTVAVVCDPP